MSTAQEEFNQLVNNNNNKSSLSHHPEDRLTPSPSPSNPSSPEPSSEPAMPPRVAANNYHIPNTVYDANTGPKGVIADAQAFERARKTSFRRTLLSAAGFNSNSSSSHNDLLQHPAAQGGENSSASEDDDDFMRKWRMSRMQELQAQGNGSNRRVSPRRRMYGYVEDVDAVGYLDAIEKVSGDTVVVVCIYDPESSDSAIVEDTLVTVAKMNPQTRFVKLHHEIAEMDHIQAPALLAYRGAEVFATIVDIARQIPKGRSVTPETLADLLKMNRVL